MSTAVRDLPSVICPECGRRSWHPTDAAEDYCGACHAFNGGGSWLVVALGRRLTQHGPVCQYPPQVCPSPDCGCAVRSQTVSASARGVLEQWWCASCRRNGLAAERPEPMVREVREFCRVDS